MTSLLGGVRNSPNLSAGSAPTPSPRGEQNKWPGSGSRAAVQEVAVVVESDRRRERKWAREPGARRGPAPRCHPPPCGLGPPSRAAPRSLPYAGLPSGDPAAAPLPPRSERGLGQREGRGKGRDEAQGGAAEGRGKAGCVCRGRVGWGRLCQFQPGGCVFYLFIFKKFVMSHITQTSRRRGGSGWGSEGGRLREVNLKIPLIEGL